MVPPVEEVVVIVTELVARVVQDFGAARARRGRPNERRDQGHERRQQAGHRTTPRVGCSAAAIAMKRTWMSHPSRRVRRSVYIRNRAVAT